MPIHVLPDQLAAQIAAGEVIERPSSVVKELIENAIDAGASEVRVEVRDGGKRLIRVADNGSGVPGDEVELAFVHHATSKLSSADDLFAIHTLGFRGEALPSIAAVSHVTLLSRAASEEIGTELKLSGGRVTGRVPHAATQGCLITVENLFHNIPARLKFLKSTPTESGHIHELVNRYALAYPTIRFSLTAENRLAFQSTGNGLMADALVVVYGVETARQMIEVPNSAQASQIPTINDRRPRTADQSLVSNLQSQIEISGYISLPSLNRANRSHMVIFVNGRAVQDRNLLYAVTEAYHTLLQVGRYPLCILKVSVPPDQVDVNVHPTKAEVRFRDAHSVFGAVQRAVRQTLLAHQDTAPAVTPSAWPSREEREASLRNIGQLGMNIQRTAPTADHRPPTALHVSTSEDISEQTSAASRLPSAVGGQAAISGQQSATGGLPMLRVLGQVARTYIIAEGPEGIFLIDQHAAHERVLYEKFLRERMARGLSVQTLLEPLPLELSPQQAARLDEQLGVMQAVGFQLEPFGGATYLLRAVPSIMAEGDPRQALTIILDELADADAPRGGPSTPLCSALDGDAHRLAASDPLRKQREAMLVASVCKQAAIKAGRVLTMVEMQALIHQLERSESPRTCPHGRPTVIRLGLEQLAREFGRG